MKLTPVNFLNQNPSYERNARPVNFFANPTAIPPLPGESNGSESLFSSNTVGLHGNYSAGDSVYIAAQAGYSAGIGHVCFNA